MERFTEAVLLALNNQNWYGALLIAITLPDICGSLENPNTKKSKEHYVNWYDRYLLEKYTSGGTVFLSGDDCYAFRCSYLHQGVDDITMQKARKIYDRFHFVIPYNGCHIHRNYGEYEGTYILQLQVDIFCMDICAGVDKWVKEVVNNSSDIQERVNSLFALYYPLPLPF